jgi:hypothetical protein
MHLPVPFRLPRRQVLLFLIAILVPCGVLVALGLQMMDQERQLESKRIADEKQRLVEQVRQELLSKLEQIKLQQVTHTGSAYNIQPEPGVVFVGHASGGQLELPWENSPEARRFARLTAEAPFAAQLHEGESQELVKQQYDKAIEQYQAAIKSASEPAQQVRSAVAGAHASKAGAVRPEPGGIRARACGASRTRGRRRHPAWSLRSPGSH